MSFLALLAHESKRHEDALDIIIQHIEKSLYKIKDIHLFEVIFKTRITQLRYAYRIAARDTSNWGNEYHDKIGSEIQINLNRILDVLWRSIHFECKKLPFIVLICDAERYLAEINHSKASEVQERYMRALKMYELSTESWVWKLRANYCVFLYEVLKNSEVAINVASMYITLIDKTSNDSNVLTAYEVLKQFYDMKKPV